MPPTASLEELTAEFEKDPSIENFVRLQRSFPNAHIRCERFAGLRQLKCLKDDLPAGLDGEVIYDALDGDGDKVDELSLQILERLIERRRREAEETQVQARKLGISDALEMQHAQAQIRYEKRVADVWPIIRPSQSSG